MINILGKSLALLQVTLSVMLLSLALAMYMNAVDFGWEQPIRYWQEAKGKKGENLLVPSLIDKREAAVRQLVRVKHDELGRLGTVQDSYDTVAHVLGANRVKGRDILEKLENGDGNFPVKTFKFGESGAMVLEPDNPASVSFPALETSVPGLNMSNASYLAKLKELDAAVTEKLASTDELLKKEKAITDRLSGKLDENGKQAVDKSGSVLDPGWYYLIEAEYQTQRGLLKEMEYLQPLWAKELVDASQVLNRRDGLLRRLAELGDKGYLSQSEFSKKIR